jgi:hypothetical protein
MRLFCFGGLGFQRFFNLELFDKPLLDKQVADFGGRIDVVV